MDLGSISGLTLMGLGGAAGESVCGLIVLVVLRERINCVNMWLCCRVRWGCLKK